MPLQAGRGIVLNSLHIILAVCPDVSTNDHEPLIVEDAA